jgi:hypothetical protein
MMDTFTGSREVDARITEKDRMNSIGCALPDSWYQGIFP